MEYYIIICASIIIIFSHLFNRLSELTNIPSVLLLIAAGIIARESMVLAFSGYDDIFRTIKEIKLIELLGTLGLIMIVLEAALDLKLSREKLPLIFRALLSSIVVLVGSAFGIAFIIYYVLDDFTFIQSMIYATPLSILSSAIVIPSVTNLNYNQKEFHIYDSTFSDIIGIMMFYFLIELSEPSSNTIAVGDFVSSLVITIFVSILLSYVLIYVFQNMETKVKLFLMIAVLLLLYSVGKMMHLSSLIIILIFGLILSNPRLFFIGALKIFHNKRSLNEIYETFHLITKESAFVVRTFFFFIFGFSVSIISLFDIKLALVSVMIILMIYLVRSGFMRLIVKAKKFKLATLIAPRGLITLLLFYSIPERLVNPSFNGGILLFVIIVTSLLMTFGLVKFGDDEVGEIQSNETSDLESET
ncbi:MAG: sodium:proton exchanger [Cytophagales bacterium]|nr:sodium:proton exchanger [Cytophagales bacterium]